MSIEIREIPRFKDLKSFVKFPFTLYRKNPYWVPPLIDDELTVFDPRKNPALEHCEVKYWMAFKDGQPVGRIAGIIVEEEARKDELARFGWIDFIDDKEVAENLLKTVEDWSKAAGMKGIHGPLGFSDMDFEGMLIEGFKERATIATIYNYPYYPKYMESSGYIKSVDWVELKSSVPPTPKRLIRKAEIIESRFGLKSLKLKSKKEAKSYGQELFEVLNKAYENLYGFHPLTQAQIDFYIKQYLGFVVTDLLSLIVNPEGELVGFAITMPSFSKAFQKAGGRLFPFGVFHILRALSKNDTVDMYLIGVLPEYQKMGVTALIFRDLMTAFNKRGIKTALTNQMLEQNQHVLGQFNEYQENSVIYKRRRCYIKRF